MKTRMDTTSNYVKEKLTMKIIDKPQIIKTFLFLKPRKTCEAPNNKCKHALACLLATAVTRSMKVRGKHNVKD